MSGARGGKDRISVLLLNVNGDIGPGPAGVDDLRGVGRRSRLPLRHDGLSVLERRLSLCAGLSGLEFVDVEPEAGDGPNAAHGR